MNRLWSLCNEEQWTASNDSVGARLKRIGCVVALSVEDTLRDRGPQWAAAIAFYSMLSLFPLLLAAVALAAYVVEPTWAVRLISQRLGATLPMGEQEIEEIVVSAYQARAATGLFSIVSLLWTGTRVFGTLTIALNVAYGVENRYSFSMRLLLELVMLLTLGVVVILALASNFLLGIVWEALRVAPTTGGLITSLLEIIVPFILMLAAFFLLYRFVPHEHTDWRAALPSALVATTIYAIARPLFFHYINQFGQQNIIYGSMAIAVILMLWAWIVALITLFGGELTAHIQRIMIEGQNPLSLRQEHEDNQRVGRSRRRQEERESEERLEADDRRPTTPPPRADERRTA